ncbi:MAG TPA: AraC family transcriptional regulator [Gemmatimonadaceae bacterium]|nr:AraC family transcriptional regulator [Gemmatimonadaceae bacterium]
MHVVALLPHNLLSHLRLVLGDGNFLEAAADAAELHSLLRSADAELLVVDPAMNEGRWESAVEEVVGSYPALPVIVYTTLTPAAMRQVVRLARVGIQHVVLNRFDDEPRRFLDLIERAPAHPLAELMLRELAAPLAALPVVVARAIEQLFRSPARVRSSQDLAGLAGMIPRTLYRHLAPLGLQPRHLVICARLLRAYTLLRDPGVRLKEIALKLGYADPDNLSEQLREWTGCSPKDVRSTLGPEAFVQALANHVLRSNAEHDVEDAAEPV